MQTEKKPKIIVCLDIASKSDIALRYACHLAKKSDFAVEISVVIEPGQVLLFAAKTIDKDRKKAARKKINKLIEDMTAKTGITPTFSIHEGEIVKTILNQAKSSSNCIMLVFGKSANIESDNSVLPKITKQISSKIKVPVVIVPESLDERRLD